MSNERLTVEGLTEAEQGLVNELWTQLCAKRTRNVLRASYYDGKNAMKHIGLSLPPSFARIATVLGWPAKAVDALNTRCKLEGFVIPGVDVDSLGMGEVWSENRLGVEASQAMLSALIHSVSWIVTTRGDERAGEPAALITVKDALSASARWDHRRRCIDAFLSVIDTDRDGLPSYAALYLPDVTVLMDRRDGGKWTVDRRRHRAGDVPVEALAFKPRLGRPFGSSRISRAVMSMTDLAMRTVYRSEVTAELYSAPQRIILGANESMFKQPDGQTIPDWKIVFGRAFGLPYDADNGQQPKLEQLPQATQEPHMAQLRSLAQLFAGETSIPVGELGISTEANPASAEAHFATREPLIALSEATTDEAADAWQRSAVRALRIRNGESEALDADLRRLRARFRNPAYTSRSSAADAVSKMVAVHPWMADSETVIDLYGFDEVTRDRLIAEKRKAGARATINALAAAARGADADAG